MLGTGAGDGAGRMVGVGIGTAGRPGRGETIPGITPGGAKEPGANAGGMDGVRWTDPVRSGVGLGGGVAGALRDAPSGRPGGGESTAGTAPGRGKEEGVTAALEWVTDVGGEAVGRGTGALRGAMVAGPRRVDGVHWTDPVRSGRGAEGTVADGLRDASPGRGGKGAAPPSEAVGIGGGAGLEGCSGWGDGSTGVGR